MAEKQITGKNVEPMELADIWGDTVRLRDLGGAMVIGITLGFVSYWGGLQLIMKQYPAMQASLQSALALVGGIAGCLLAAVISAKLFPPKRSLTEQHFSVEDSERVLDELQVDRAQEAEDMLTMDPAIVREMQELQIDGLFRSGGPANGEK